VASKSINNAVGRLGDRFRARDADFDVALQRKFGCFGDPAGSLPRELFILDLHAFRKACSVPCDTTMRKTLNAF
jgi:hypothetical protein